MKKLLLLLAASAATLSADAQNSVVFVESQKATGITQMPEGMTKERATTDYMQRRNERMRFQDGTANKGPRTARRTYNYIDLLFTQTPGITTNQGFAYMWHSYRAMASYSGGYDTINTASFGQTIQPWYNKWNSAFGFPGLPWMKDDAIYKLDTVILYGSYQRNPAKVNVVDTMRFSFFYGNGAAGSNVETRLSVAGANSIATEYGVDSMRYVRVPYDSATVTARQGTSGTTVIHKDIPLTANWIDTTAQGLDIIRVPVNMTVPAGNIVGAVFTFKTGDASFISYDTALVAGPNNTVVPKYNMFRPRSFEQNLGALPNYYSDNNYNNGLMQLYPLDGATFYLPTYFLTAPSASEFFDIDFVISGGEFEERFTGVNETGLIGNVSAFPNPANATITVPVTMNDAAVVTISITNAVGQVIKTQSLGKVAANATVEASFNTNDMASGIYLYTVEAAGQRITNRFSVAH